MIKYTESNIKNSYSKSPIAEPVRNAFGTSLRRFPIMLKNYVSIVDEDSGDIVYFFPLNDINKCPQEIKKIVLDDLISNWKKAGFSVKQENYPEKYNIGFLPLIYRLSA